MILCVCMGSAIPIIRNNSVWCDCYRITGQDSEITKITEIGRVSRSGWVTILVEAAQPIFSGKTRACPSPKHPFDSFLSLDLSYKHPIQIRPLIETLVCPHSTPLRLGLLLIWFVSRFFHCDWVTCEFNLWGTASGWQLGGWFQTVRTLCALVFKINLNFCALFFQCFCSVLLVFWLCFCSTLSALFTSISPKCLELKFN